MNKPSFVYEEEDAKGQEILEAISAAGAFNKWMFSTIRPFCQGRILEIGSGVGNISSFFIHEGATFALSDIREGYRERLKRQFANQPVYNIDIVDPHFALNQEELLGSFDTCFALNVVEHVEDDSLAIQNMLQLLKPGGRLIILVPAYQWLYNPIDKSLGHYRRYTPSSLSQLMRAHGPLEKLFSFNFTGIAAWWMGGKLFRQDTIPKGEMKLYNTFVPVFKIVDKMVFNKVGLSVIGVIKKP
jgi:SAM-dependent methyltransferase